ncbi:hypothetical protein ACFJIU_11895 [Mesorhizobium sp. UC74_2]|uniref:hypothetical protein n=1 Tax=Mesorhizobium sp. UC74_2 TaxID=3350171 RepID=UPI00367166FA
MAIFAELTFVVVVAIAYVLVQVPVAIPRTTWFGAINLCALVALFGWRSTVVVAAVGVSYWMVLWLIAKFDKRPTYSAAIYVLAFASVGLLFVGHKMLLEPGNDFSVWAPFKIVGMVSQQWPAAQAFSLLQLVAFSYVCLRLVDAIRAVGAGERLLDPLGLIGFLVPFFMTPSGPINEYEDHLTMDETEPAHPSAAHFVDSLWLVVCGYFLKFAVAQSLGLFVRGIDGAWPVATFWDSTVFLAYVFLEFCGYSLIALGVGKLLSVPTPVNFNHPYLATSFADFWTRWHMSLGSFVKRTFYFPVRVWLTRSLKPARHETAKIHLINAIALIVPFTLVGLWHRFTWIFLLWGLAVGIAVAAETIIREVWGKKGGLSLPAWVARPIVSIYSVALVVLILQIALQDFAK